VPGLKLSQYKIYGIGLVTTVVPIYSGVLISQIHQQIVPSWALFFSGVVAAATAGCTLSLIRYIKKSLSLDDFSAMIDTLSTPLLIADRQHQLKHCNTAAQKIDVFQEADDTSSIVDLFHQAISSELHSDKDSELSAHLLDKLVAPLHLNCKFQGKEYRVLFKPIMIRNIRMGTVVEFQDVSVEYTVSLPNQPIENIQAIPQLPVEHLVANMQNAMIVVDEDLIIQHLNSSMAGLLKLTEDMNDQDLSAAFEGQTEQLKAFFEQALKFQEKTDFLQDGSTTVDWTVTPLIVDNQFKGYIIEAHSPAKQEVEGLKNSLLELGHRADTCEKEIAHFVNLLGHIDLYHNNENPVVLDLKNYKHPLLRKGIKSVRRLADVVQQSSKEVSTMRAHITQQHIEPQATSNQFSVLSQALLRNLEELKRDYCALKNHQAEHSRIVNEHKGITQNLNQVTEHGYLLTQECRGKVLSGFETVTLIVQSMQQFENQLSAMLQILDDTQNKIKKTGMGQDVSTTLELFIQSLTDQIRQANIHCKKNKSRLNILIPSYTSHHLQMGQLKTQWQNSLKLIQTQESTLSEWRGYQKQENLYQSQLEVRLEELHILSEKVLQKSMHFENKDYQNGNLVSNVTSGLVQFDDMILKSGVPQVDIDFISEKS